MNGFLNIAFVVCSILWLLKMLWSITKCVTGAWCLSTLNLCRVYTLYLSCFVHYRETWLCCCFWISQEMTAKREKPGKTHADGGKCLMLLAHFVFNTSVVCSSAGEVCWFTWVCGLLSLPLCPSDGLALRQWFRSRICGHDVPSTCQLHVTRISISVCPLCCLLV